MDQKVSDAIIHRLNEAERQASDAAETAWQGKELYMRGGGSVRDRDSHAERDGVYWSHWCCQLAMWEAAAGGTPR